MRLANRAARGMPRTRLAISAQHCEDRNFGGRSERINFSQYAMSGNRRRRRRGGLEPMASEEEEAAARVKIRQALGAGEPHPGLRSRAIASTPGEGDAGRASPRRWVAGGVAAVMALTIAAGLMFFRQRSTTDSAASGQQVGALNMTIQLGFQCTLPVQGYL